MLFVPSLKPIRLRGVFWALLVLEVRPKPSWDHRITANPRPILARFRTAWKATCGSSAQAWTQRSPPERSGSRLSPGSSVMGWSAPGLREANPKRSSPSFSKSVGPNPKVTVRCPAVRSWASPVSSGGTKASSFSPPTGCPAHILAAASDQDRIRSLTSLAFEVVRSKEAKCNLSCWGVAMPAWCSPKNSTVWSASASSLADRAPPVPNAIPAPKAPASVRALRRLIFCPSRESFVSSFLPMSLRPSAQYPADPGEGFGEGVDLLAELAPLFFIQLFVAGPAVATTVRLYLLLHVLESCLYLGHQLGVLTLHDGLYEGEGDLRPLHVRCDVVEVGMRITLFLSRDLGRRHLVQQLHSPEDGIGGLELHVVHLALQALDVGHQLIGVLVLAFCGVLHPEGLLYPVETGPLLVRDVALPGVHLGIEGSELLRDRLDPLPWYPRRRIELFGFCHVPGLYGGHELFRTVHEQFALTVHVVLVLAGGPVEFRAAFDVEEGGLLLHLFLGLRFGRVPGSDPLSLHVATRRDEHQQGRADRNPREAFDSPQRIPPKPAARVACPVRRRVPAA